MCYSNASLAGWLAAIGQIETIALQHVESAQDCYLITQPWLAVRQCFLISLLVVSCRHCGYWLCLMQRCWHQRGVSMWVVWWVLWVLKRVWTSWHAVFERLLSEVCSFDELILISVYTAMLGATAKMLCCWLTVSIYAVHLAKDSFHALDVLHSAGLHLVPSSFELAVQKFWHGLWAVLPYCTFLQFWDLGSYVLAQAQESSA